MSDGYGESLSTRLDRLAEAVTDGHVSLSADGIHVDVRANGDVIALTLDEHRVPDGRYLGAMIASLINEARGQAQAQLEALVNEIQADPRITTIVEQIGDAPARALPRHGHHDTWDDTFHERSASPVFGDWESD
ncbi:hypothetical protein ACFXHA_36665 [Nocardia sp. NPDC059240]|uniref:hypothetical protein n=1 Tax=Nocardia sp. NPDC059240 TaxID=3346786 RepID=UPI0036C01508